MSGCFSVACLIGGLRLEVLMRRVFTATMGSCLLFAGTSSMGSRSAVCRPSGSRVLLEAMRLGFRITMLSLQIHDKELQPAWCSICTSRAFTWHKPLACQLTCDDRSLGVTVSASRAAMHRWVAHS